MTPEEHRQKAQRLDDKATEYHEKAKALEGDDIDALYDEYLDIMCDYMEDSQYHWRMAEDGEDHVH